MIPLKYKPWSVKKGFSASGGKKKKKKKRIALGQPVQSMQGGREGGGFDTFAIGVFSESQKNCALHDSIHYFTQWILWI